MNVVIYYKLLPIMYYILFYRPINCLDGSIIQNSISKMCLFSSFGNQYIPTNVPAYWMMLMI